ncbi:ABC transporter substrate-binding protein [Paraburkholderia caballeronis]|uniref:Putative spermidine/putrescine transport system substrate-binding protein n=1 Tax=Paraburkholderia caballeronis TaxID=416943 RepID=A0A1H7QKA7_9BURK|nr:ABC transporter substrate-binding protein [Paraburkholderia caballeronis]PXW22516.1 putative spermidine/putrescine transport system substrate-binding protein [Paraburkholderia caballeronis]PXW96387.1 putative spermidine/putrescine transport system substrate-binding protein [Paraburkholderia caballeronis]RAJ92798.1 putative spermidine/putrescine transport system substrate-binding protein [Paraburkholderia caballeronis]TDV15042.1 putative spermidine/putrescine transport system substrate-bindin
MNASRLKPRPGSIATALAFALLPTAAFAADTLSVVTFGGAYETAAENAWFKPFTAKTGTSFSTESYDGGLAKLQAMEQARNPTWDLVDMETNDAINACDEGLIEKLDPKMLGKTGDFLPGSLLDCSVAAMVWSTVYAYDTTRFKAPPTTIADFFDLAKFPGKRGMRKSPKAALEWALMADGVAPHDVYKVLATPDGVNRAFKKLDTIKSSIVWWDAGSQAPQLLADGAVVMTQAYNGRIDAAVHDDKKPFRIVWDGQVYDYEWWAVPTGAKHADQAKKFIAFSAQPQAYADLSRYIAYAPPRKDSIPLIDKARLADLPTAPANFKHALQIDATFWADNADAIDKRFQTWLTQ